MIIRTVNIICLAVLFLELAILAANLIFKKRAERIAFLRGFRSGGCAMIYIIAVPLYCLGYVYAGGGLLESFFKATSKILNLVVLQYDTSEISLLMEADALYSFSIYLCFFIVLINAIILALSLVSQYAWSVIEGLKVAFLRAPKLYIFGNNDENVSIYNSDKHRSKAIIADLSKEEKEKLYLNRVTYISTSSMEKSAKRLLKLNKTYTREHFVVINTGDDEQNLSIVRTIIDDIDALAEAERENLLFHLRVFVFGDTKYETIYNDAVSKGHGCIHYVNKYKRATVDFIDKYPFTAFMDERHIDYDTSLIKENVDINVLLVGFGHTNRHAFLLSVANNQFLCRTSDGTPELKQVNYHIFDRVDAKNDKNLNHSYYRYKIKLPSMKEEDYLPLPALPANESYYQIDVNDEEFYSHIKNIVTKNENDVNFLIIAYGNDLDNIDLAQKFVEKRREWELENLVIFVKARHSHKESMLSGVENCYFFGNEEETVYNIDKIANNTFYNMAQMRNEIYDLEYNITHDKNLVFDEAYIENNHITSYKNWFVSKTQFERDNSMYCCLSLRSKLHLMGLDFIPKEEGSAVGLSEEEYLEIYARGDMPKTENHKTRINGKKIVDYTLDFPDSKRKNLAIQEHYRWNSFLISRGMVPATVEQIKSEKILRADGREKFSNGKNYAVRRHGNLTSFEGLEEFRRIVAQRDGCDELEADVIKYDYQLLDDAHWLLDKNGYKIVKREKSKK